MNLLYLFILMFFQFSQFLNWPWNLNLFKFSQNFFLEFGWNLFANSNILFIFLCLFIPKILWFFIIVSEFLLFLVDCSTFDQILLFLKIISNFKNSTFLVLLVSFKFFTSLRILEVFLLLSFLYCFKYKCQKTFRVLLLYNIFYNYYRFSIFVNVFKFSTQYFNHTQLFHHHFTSQNQKTVPNIVKKQEINGRISSEISFTVQLLNFAA